MGKSWSGRIAIVGIGESDLGTVFDKDPMQLHAQASVRALEDCGLSNKDVDGVLTAGIANQLILMHSAVFAEYMGISPRFTTSMQIGGATHIQLIISAANAIACGMADVVLIAAADSIRSLTGYGEFMSMMGEGVTDMFSRIGHSQFEVPYGPTLISTYALGATRHMDEFGTTPEQLAQVAVSIRKHASMHPDAQKREPLTIDEVLSSKMISSPLTKDMCSTISDGGGAMIVTSEERARDLDIEPVLVLGAGARTTQEHVTLAGDLTTHGSVDAGRQAYEMAGMGPKDMDFAELYDCFSITPIIFLEDFEGLLQVDGYDGYNALIRKKNGQVIRLGDIATVRRTFKDPESYRKHTKAIFDDTPSTPYGYFSEEHQALIMNIATGGGTLIHEMVHAFMKPNFPDCPAWFNEGLGSLYEGVGWPGGKIRGYTNWRLPGLKQAIKLGRVPNFKALMAQNEYRFYERDDTRTAIPNGSNGLAISEELFLGPTFDGVGRTKTLFVHSAAPVLAGACL